MERRSPTGIDRREAVETPHRRRSRARKWSAGLRPASTAERRSKPHIAVPGGSRQKAGSKPSGFAAISFFRGADAPQRRGPPTAHRQTSGRRVEEGGLLLNSPKRGRQRSAGLRPASSPAGGRNHVPPIRLTVHYPPALLPSPRYAPAPVGHGGCHASCSGNRQSGTVASENACAEPRSAALGTLPALCPIGGSPRSLSTPIRLFAQLPATPGRC